MDDTTHEDASMSDELTGDGTHEDVTVEEAVEDPVDELTAALRERDEANDRFMRLQADFQNQRRHAQANIDAAAQSARREVLDETVTILDYLDMALAAEVTSDDAKNLKIGVEMTRSQLQSFLDRLDVEPIETVGAFDPARHQAVSTVETADVEPGTIVEVVRKGWTVNGEVLRYAQVRVAAAPENA